MSNIRGGGILPTRVLSSTSPNKQMRLITEFTNNAVDQLQPTDILSAGTTINIINEKVAAGSEGSTGNYVTLDTEQTITAWKTFRVMITFDSIINARGGMKLPNSVWLDGKTKSGLDRTIVCVDSEDSILLGHRLSGVRILSNSSDIIHRRVSVDSVVYDSGNSNNATTDWEARNISAVGLTLTGGSVMAGSVLVGGDVKIATTLEVAGATTLRDRLVVNLSTTNEHGVSGPVTTLNGGDVMISNYNSVAAGTTQQHNRIDLSGMTYSYKSPSTEHILDVFKIADVGNDIKLVIGNSRHDTEINCVTFKVNNRNILSELDAIKVKIGL